MNPPDFYLMVLFIHPLVSVVNKVQNFSFLCQEVSQISVARRWSLEEKSLLSGIQYFLWFSPFKITNQNWRFLLQIFYHYYQIHQNKFKNIFFFAKIPNKLFSSWFILAYIIINFNYKIWKTLKTRIVNLLLFILYSKKMKTNLSY